MSAATAPKKSRAIDERRFHRRIRRPGHRFTDTLGRGGHEFPLVSSARPILIADAAEFFGPEASRSCAV